jgi:hypothetical protein
MLGLVFPVFGRNDEGESMSVISWSAMLGRACCNSVDCYTAKLGLLA